MEIVEVEIRYGTFYGEAIDFAIDALLKRDQGER